MSWSNDTPPRYSLHFEELAGPVARPEGCGLKLVADSLEDAKLEAAILYACVDLPTPPKAYRIVKGARSVVYRYPEARHLAQGFQTLVA
jgi:hypothetical protein